MQYQEKIHPVLKLCTAGYRRLGINKGSVVLAVSGGADSMALLLCTHALRAQFAAVEVACLDHGIRPEAAGEVERVREHCRALGLPFHTRALNLAGGASFEDRARKARYAALEEIRNIRNLDWIATAHTASDQAETLLMRLSRGAALKGAAGVLERKGRVVRPLLCATRAQIESFLAASETEFVRDPMNADPAFLRTRIRADVLPALERAAGPTAALRMGAFARIAAEDDAWLQGEADLAYGRLLLAPGQLDSVGVRALPRPLGRRVIARLLQESGAAVDLLAVETILDNAARGARSQVGGKAEVLCAGGRIRASAVGSFPPADSATLEVHSPPWVDSRSGLRIGVAPAPRNARWYFPLLAPRWPLEVRHWRAGDRVRSRSGGSRKLQDVFVDLKVPREERSRIPLVCDAQGQILWVVGVWPRQVPGVGVGLCLYAEIAADPSAPLPGSL